MIYDMPDYDHMDYDELVTQAQVLWLKNAKLFDLALNTYRMMQYAVADGKCAKHCSYWPECTETGRCDIERLARATGVKAATTGTSTRMSQ